MRMLKSFQSTAESPDVHLYAHDVVTLGSDEVDAGDGALGAAEHPERAGARAHRRRIHDVDRLALDRAGLGVEPDDDAALAVSDIDVPLRSGERGRRSADRRRPD